MTSPIALFVYNRPSHTRQTVESLLENPEARDSDLYVFSDGPSDESAAGAVAEVRSYIRNITGFRNVIVEERDVNLGLAESIVGGVTLVCDAHGRAIVVEDDLVTSPFFLGFMNKALDCYENAPTVMHVSGSAYPIKRRALDGTYFLRVPLCWGWGTWNRAWSGFERDLSIMEQFDKRLIHEFDFHGSSDYWRQLVLNRRGIIGA